MSLISPSGCQNYTAHQDFGRLRFWNLPFPPRNLVMNASQTTRSGPLIIAILVVLLLIAHQDNWFWTDDTLVFGFMPIGLFWHVCISLAAAGVWWLATQIAWPFDEQETSSTSNREGQAE